MKIMNESTSNKNGYVYILEVKDIDLPVCKIGMTSRSPSARCSEINKNSTGDVESNLKNGIELLKPVHEWVTKITCR
jgi:hypothetical protein